MRYRTTERAEEDNLIYIPGILAPALCPDGEAGDRAIPIKLKVHHLWGKIFANYGRCDPSFSHLLHCCVDTIPHIIANEFAGDLAGEHSINVQIEADVSWDISRLMRPVSPPCFDGVPIKLVISPRLINNTNTHKISS